MELGVSQNYFILALPEKGKLSISNSKGIVGLGLLVAGLIDMQLAGAISIKKKKISIESELNLELGYLTPLYNYIKSKKEVSIFKLTDYYVTSVLKKPFDTYQKGLATSLKNANLVIENSGKLSVIEGVREQIVMDTKLKFTNNYSELDEKTYSLLVLLKKSDLLKIYFSKMEIEFVNKNVKKIDDSDANKILKEVLASITSFYGTSLFSIFFN